MQTQALSRSKHVGVLASCLTLGALGCSPTVMGEHNVAGIPDSIKNTALEYVCQVSGDRLVVADGADGARAWLLPPYPNMGSFGGRTVSSELTHHVRDEQGDHFLRWVGDPPETARDYVVPHDRSTDARLVGYSSPDLRFKVRDHRVVGFEGRGHAYLCWRNRRDAGP